MERDQVKYCLGITLNSILIISSIEKCTAFSSNIFNGGHSWLISIEIGFAIVTNKNHEVVRAIDMSQMARLFSVCWNKIRKSLLKL